MLGPSLLWAEFVWTDFAMGRVYNGPSLLQAKMSSYPLRKSLVGWLVVLDLTAL